MRRILYRISLWLIALVTLGTIAFTFWGAVSIPADFEAAGLGAEAAHAAVALKLGLDLFVWALIVVPLGIIALLLRPPRNDHGIDPGRAAFAAPRREPHF